MKVFFDYTQEELDRQYEHRFFVEDVDRHVAYAKAESARVRAAAQGRFDIPYGQHRDELLDVYQAGNAAGPVPAVVFFHGGRWSRGGKGSSCDSAEIFTGTGIHFVSVNYTLLPKTTMDVLIHQCRSAIAWLWRNADACGIDRDRLYVMGKSSGAHVGGMMVTTDWDGAFGLPADLLKGGLLISGMYDLEPVRRTFRNDFLKLDEEAAARNSPVRRIPDAACPLVVGCGELETDEFRRQTREFAAAWAGKGHVCRYMEVPGRHHYSVSADMGDSPLISAFFGLMAEVPAVS